MKNVKAGLMVALLVASAASASAQNTTNTWTAGVSTDGNTPANRSQNRVPTKAAPLPVTLVNFSARRRTATRAQVQLVWVTATELNNRGFRLERSVNGLGWNALDFIAGSGANYSMNTYITVDSCRTAAYYRLAEVNLDGTSAYSPVVHVGAATVLNPARMSLFPSPATSTVNVLNADSDQTLRVFNVMGEQVRELPAGTRRFDASAWPHGIYFVRQNNQMAKLILE